MLSMRRVTVLIASGAVAAGVALTGASAALAEGPDTPPEVLAEIEAADWPVLEEGQVAWEVSVVKFLLFDFGYLDVNHADENFDEDLTEAVTEYQSDNGLDDDGVVDEDTWEQLTEDFGVVSAGDEGNLVKAVQYALINGYGYDLVMDGQYGELTTEAVTDFQTETGIDPDGDTGPITFEALLTE